jgi:hypothetical protein
MKGFKKLALVAAIAAPLSSVHALEAIDDAMLSDMTGQSGVTVDLETQVSIGSVTWTDEGSLNLNSIKVGGFDPSQGTMDLTDPNVLAAVQQAAQAGDTDAATLLALFSTQATGTTDFSKLDDVRLVIDEAASGDLEILVVTQSGFNADGTVTQNGVDAGAPVDLGISVGSVSLAAAEGNANTATATIASNINLNVLLGPQKFVVKNTGDNGLIQAKGYFKLHESSSLDLDVAGVSVTSLEMGELSGTGGYGNGEALTVAAAGVTGYDADYTKKGLAFYDVTIGTKEVAGNDALNIAVNSFNVDMKMGVNIGGASIGTVGITDLQLDGTSLTVYGH